MVCRVPNGGTLVASAPALTVGQKPGETRRLRIAHVTATYPPYFGGTGNVACHNAVHLARRGHEVHVFTVDFTASRFGPLPSKAGPELSEGVTIHRASPALRFGNAPFAPDLLRGLDGFDLVHLHYPFYFGGEQVWRHCSRHGTPYLVTYHQDVLLARPLAHGVRLHHRLLGERVLRAARLVGVTTRDYATTSWLGNLRGLQIEEIPNGVDTTRFRPGLDPTALRERYCRSADQPVVLFVGGLDRAHYFKGIPVLLWALRELPDVTLLIVGDGDLRPSYERQAREMGLSNRVHFAGRVANAQLPHYYALANVAVLPSTTRSEAFGLVLLEAMACGTPVVASRLPGVRTVVSEGVDGLLAEPGDPANLAVQIRTILAEPARATDMGAAGRRKVEERFDWSHIAARLEALYAETLTTPGWRRGVA